MEKLLNQYGVELLSCKVQSGGISIATFCCIILLMLILGLVGRRAAILASVCRKNKPFIVITALNQRHRHNLCDCFGSKFSLMGIEIGNS